MKDLGGAAPGPGGWGKMPELNSFPWVELAVLAPGQSHYWFFDQTRDLHGWVFQATAYPEPPDAGGDNELVATRVEVSELFVLRKRGENQGGKRGSQINITVTNCGDRWAPYSLWVVSIPPRKMPRHAYRPQPLNPGPQAAHRKATRNSHENSRRP
jgi:hypothetical protein